MKKIVLKVWELKNIIIEVLIKAGVKAEYASILADSCCEADLRGVHSHGIKMLPAYLERIEKGGVVPEAEPELSESAKGIYIVDGKGCFGQIAASCAMNRIIQDVRLGQMSCAVVKNTNHCGMLAYYTEKIAEEFAVGFMTSNTNPNVAAFGGAEKVLGTNPFSIAFPKDDGNIVIDMATTAAAKGKVYEYDKKGEDIPSGWAIDKEGKATTNPKEALEGIMLAFGGHKGYAISLAVEILSGVISNSGYSKNVLSLHNCPEKVQNVGFFMAALPIKAFLDRDLYNERIDDLSNILVNSKKQIGNDRILLPGQMENDKRKLGISMGLEVDEDILNVLRKGVLNV